MSLHFFHDLTNLSNERIATTLYLKRFKQNEMMIKTVRKPLELTIYGCAEGETRRHVTPPVAISKKNRKTKMAQKKKLVNVCLFNGKCI